MKLLSIIMIVGSLLMGQAAMAKTACSAAQGNDTIGHPDLEDAYTWSDVKKQTTVTTPSTDDTTTDQ
jgi:hypothetical protein